MKKLYITVVLGLVLIALVIAPVAADPIRQGVMVTRFDPMIPGVGFVVHHKGGNMFRYNWVDKSRDDSIRRTLQIFEDRVHSAYLELCLPMVLPEPTDPLQPMDPSRPMNPSRSMDLLRDNICLPELDRYSPFPKHIGKLDDSNYWEPAWILELVGYDVNQIASYTISKGGGVKAELIPDSCVASERPPSSLIATNSNARCEPDQTGGRAYILFSVAPNALPGERNLVVSLTTGSVIKLPLVVARYGRVQLEQVNYKDNEFKIPINELHQGNFSIMGSANPDEARVVEFEFSGNYVDGLKFYGEECMFESGLTSGTITNFLPDNFIFWPTTATVTTQFQYPLAGNPLTNGTVASRTDLPSEDCSLFLYDPIMDKVVQHFGSKEGTRLSNFNFLPGTTGTISIGPKFLTIAGMGDSYASGEGAPDSFNQNTKIATWEDKQCHRSANSSLTQGVKKLAEIPGVWVLYQNFACSGASISLGLTGDYAGLPHPNPSDQNRPENKRSQILQVEQWLSDQQLNELDALLLSIGGNDIGFSRVIADCISPLILNCKTNTFLLNAVFHGDPGNTSVTGLGNLPADYVEFNNRLHNTPFKPGQIFITEYPDPLHRSLNSFCDSVGHDFAVVNEDIPWSDEGEITPEHPWARYLEVGAKISNLTHDEIVWAFDPVLTQLNDTVADAAGANEWHFISGFVEHSRDRGFCNDNRYVNTLADSFNVQGDIFGAVHPKRHAYHLYGDIIARELALFFNLPDRPDITVVEDELFGLPPVEGGLNPITVQGPNRFDIQIAPTTRPLSVEFAFVRRDRVTGDQIGSVNTIPALLVGNNLSRVEFFVTRNLRVCETLEYWWQIQHGSSDDMKIKTTERTSVTPVAHQGDC